MSVKLCYIDTETTGLDAKRHGIIQLAAIMEIDGVEVATFSAKMRPASSCAADPSALEISGNTIEMIKAYTPEAEVYRDFVAWLGEHVSKFDKLDKAFFSGYNSPFDVEFVRALFDRNGDKYFGSWFWSGSIDVMGAALWALRDRRQQLPNFKLGTVAEFVLGGEAKKLSEATGLHDALTDIRVTRALHRAILA
jgi:DNA polymerase-3 subunit epsilon